MTTQVIEREVYSVSPYIIEAAREIVEGLTQARTDIFNTCQKYVKLIDEHPEAKNYFIQNCSLRTADLLQMERVGRGKLHPELADKSGVGYQKLRSCVYSDQAKYISEPVEVLLCNGDVLKVSVADLTKEQANQVFNYDKIRDIAAQKAFLESVKSSTAVDIVRKQSPYTVTKQGLRVGSLLITKNELLNILSEM